MKAARSAKFWTAFWLAYIGWYARAVFHYGEDARWGWTLFSLGMIPVSFLWARWNWHRYLRECRRDYLRECKRQLDNWAARS